MATAGNILVALIVAITAAIMYGGLAFGMMIGGILYTAVVTLDSIGVRISAVIESAKK